MERLFRFDFFVVPGAEFPASGHILAEKAQVLEHAFERLPLADQRQFGEYLRLHLRGKGIPRMSARLEKHFKQSIFEVFQNSVVHSGSRLEAFVCGQFYPTRRRLRLTIADAGIGIRTNVREYLNRQISSVEAIRWAMQAGNTTRTGKLPGGVGLKFLKDFIKENNGKIQIVSRRGFYEFNAHVEKYEKLQGDFRGTVVTFEINTADTASYRLSSEVSPRNVF